MFLIKKKNSIQHTHISWEYRYFYKSKAQMDFQITWQTCHHPILRKLILDYLENLLIQTISNSSQNYAKTYKTYTNINQNKYYSFNRSHLKWWEHRWPVSLEESSHMLQIPRNICRENSSNMGHLFLKGFRNFGIGYLTDYVIEYLQKLLIRM